jgi:hypothetical protein
MMKPLRRNSLRKFLAPAAMALAFPALASGPREGITPVLSPTTVVISKTLNNKKHKIRLYKAVNAGSLLFTVDGMEGKKYQLFVFDLEGKLITESDVHNRETSILAEIPAGAYLFDVFMDDKKVEAGQLTVK